MVCPSEMVCSSQMAYSSSSSPICMRQIPLVAELFDQVHLGFEKVHVVFFIL